MLAPRVLRSRRASPLLRPFCSSAAHNRAPSIRDITPDSAAQFNARQKEFRENLEAARKRKEQQESQSVAASASDSAPVYPRDRLRDSTAAPTAPRVSNASGDHRSVIDAAATLDHQALGSLSTHRIVGEEQQADSGNQSSKRGPFSSLIYGTKEGQQLDRDIERSFSEVLARGKYVHSIVFHEVKPDKVDEYVDLVGQWYPRMAAMKENKVNLVGSWRTQVGDNDTFGTGCDMDITRVLPPISELTIFTQSTSGSISATQATTPPCMPSPVIPNFPNSIGSSNL